MTHTKSYAKLIDTVRETGGDVDTMTAFAECVIAAYQAAQPAPVPMAHIVGEIDHNGKVWTPAQPAVPDAFGTREGEHPQYIQGWNDCRAEILKGKA
jgi:hypothetical protein